MKQGLGPGGQLGRRRGFCDHGGRLVLAQQGPQPGGQRLGALVDSRRQPAVALDLVDQLGRVVQRIQQGIGQLGAVGQVAVAHAVEGVLAGMHHQLQGLEFEQAAIALEGVDGAEQVVQQLGIARVALDVEQALADGFEAFARLGDELVEEFGGIHAVTFWAAFTAWARSPSSRAAVSTRAPGRAGLTR